MQFLKCYKMLINKVLQSLENFDNRILKYSDSDTLMVCWIENFFKTIKWSCGWKFKHFVELSINLGKFWLSVHQALINCFKMLVFLKTNGLKSSLFNKGQCITFINNLNKKHFCWYSIFEAKMKSSLKTLFTSLTTSLRGRQRLLGEMEILLALLIFWNNKLVWTLVIFIFRQKKSCQAWVHVPSHSPA